MSISDAELTDKEYSIQSFYDREVILTKLSESIDYLHHKSLNGRVNDKDNEKIRIQWFKTFAYTCSIFNQVKKDIDVDILAERIDNMREEIKSLRKIEDEKRD